MDFGTTIAFTLISVTPSVFLALLMRSSNSACPFKEATIKKYWHQNKQELFSTFSEKVRSASATIATIINAAGKEGFELIQE